MPTDTRSRTGTDNLVSVVIPCYNHGRFLAEAIESALSQAHDPKEVIVVDDGSVDETAEVAARYDVRYVHQENAGLSAARNTGLRESAGAYVVFLDADDRLLPGALAAGLACLNANPECEFAFGTYRHIAADGSYLRPSHPPAAGPDLYLALLYYNHIGLPATVMYRRGVLDLLGGFDTRLKAAQDYDLYFRIARQFPIERHPHVVAEYRKHDSSLSADPALMLREILCVLRRERRHIGRRQSHLEAWATGMRRNRGYYLEQHLETLARRSRGATARRIGRSGAALALYYRDMHAELVARVAERDRAIEQLQATHEELDRHARRHIEHLTAQVSERDALILNLQAEMHEKIAEANRIIAALHQGSDS